MNAPLKYAELQAPFQAPLEALDLTIQLESRAQKRLTLRKLKNSFGPLAFVACLVGFLIWAWLNSDNGVLTPKDGTGYWFGIAGTTMMGIVLLYPLRKRIKSVRDWGELPRWFRLHMVLGLCGPALIVAHSNFSVHSANAIVAFVAMLVVAASGVVGRYLYAQTHRGLYGAKLEAKELLSRGIVDPQANWCQAVGTVRLGGAPDRNLKPMPSSNPRPSWARSRTISSWGAWSGKHERACCSSLRNRCASGDRRFGPPASCGKRQGKHVRARIDRYFRAVRRAGNLDGIRALFRALACTAFAVDRVSGSYNADLYCCREYVLVDFVSTGLCGDFGALFWLALSLAAVSPAGAQTVLGKADFARPPRGQARQTRSTLRCLPPQFQKGRTGATVQCLPQGGCRRYRRAQGISRKIPSCVRRLPGLSHRPCRARCAHHQIRYVDFQSRFHRISVGRKACRREVRQLSCRRSQIPRCSGQMRRMSPKGR